MTVSQLAELSKLSKSYITQVKTGIRPPSRKLIEALQKETKKHKLQTDYLHLFIQSRKAMGVSPRTVQYYRERLSKFVSTVDYLRAKRKDVERYLNTIPPNQYGLATRHASFRTIKTFYRWLNSEFDLPNPINGMPAPILGKPILPTLDRTEVQHLIDSAETSRDKAIIALFVESGLRVAELANIKHHNIDWKSHTIKMLGKGRKEAYAPFGDLSEQYLKDWFKEYSPNGSLWGLNQWGITSVLRRLEKETGLPCNPHTFRRTFACLLRKAGVDTMTIKDLGR